MAVSRVSRTRTTLQGNYAFEFQFPARSLPTGISFYLLILLYKKTKNFQQLLRPHDQKWNINVMNYRIITLHPAFLINVASSIILIYTYIWYM